MSFAENPLPVDRSGSLELDRCADIILRRVKMFEQKRLYNTARALRDVLSEILDEDTTAERSGLPTAINHLARQ